MSSSTVDRVNVVPLISLSKAGKPYTYGVRERLRGLIRPGMLVQVPFRNRPAIGIVFDLDGGGEISRVVEIQSIVDPYPVLLPYQLDLARWISREYVAPLSDVLSCMLPPALKKVRAPAISVERAVEVTGAGRSVVADSKALKRSKTQRALLEILNSSDVPMAIRELNAGKSQPTAPMKALAAAGLIRFVETEFAAEPTPTKGGGYAPGRESESETIEARRLSPHQSAAVSAIVGVLAGAPGDPRFQTRHGSDDEEGTANVGDPSPNQSPVFLLHGVTGSGKTEVYMSVIAEALRRGQSATVLVPEISLTPQAIERFEERFPGLVASVHSRMPSGERRKQWERLRSGEARIAVGPRSALFSPLANLGVIFLDEEHDASYKQEESPRYHARDVAIHLGGMLGVPVVLGSATPDVASYYHARKCRYRLLDLPDRPIWWTRAEAGDATGDETPTAAPDGQGNAAPPSRPMPSVEIVDLRQELKAGNRSIFSRSLRSALEETLAAHEQALLFLNRRGAATSVVCRDCGYVATCRSCDLPLTYHSYSRVLVCHRCDRRFPPPSRCPTCGGDRIRYLGVGTQRVAEEVATVLPGARVRRWDRDVTGKKGSHESIASAFARHEFDILVGTQMIAKGLDFPLVTLVGVIVADVGLNLPDFRAPERTFQLMTQVAGRAGRAKLPSRVVVQAYNPEHYALQAARNHDYWSFYRQEMTFRHASGYPPYSRLVRLLLKGKDDERVGRNAHALRDALLLEAARRSHTAGPRPPAPNPASRANVQGWNSGPPNPDEFEIIGPAPAFTSRVNDVFQWHLVLRGRDVHQFLGVVPDDVVVDVDPVDLL